MLCPNHFLIERNSMTCIIILYIINLLFIYLLSQQLKTYKSPSKTKFRWIIKHLIVLLIESCFRPLPWRLKKINTPNGLGWTIDEAPPRHTQSIPIMTFQVHTPSRKHKLYHPMHRNINIATRPMTTSQIYFDQVQIAKMGMCSREA